MCMSAPDRWLRLDSIRERIHPQGGKLAIASKTGEGNRTTARDPLTDTVKPDGYTLALRIRP